MKNLFNKIHVCWAMLLIVMVNGCKEHEFSENYDMSLPVSKIVDFNPKTDFVDKQITLYGENLDLVTNVYIGSTACSIVSQGKDNMIIKVARDAGTGKISVTNKYKRTYETTNTFVPKYLDVTVQTWPTEIERGLTIKINGQNMDMIETVKFENITLSKASATVTTATYSTANLTLPNTGKLTVTSKTGQTLTSGIINVIEPKDTYIPSPTIILFDFDDVEPTIEGGNATGAGATFTSGKNKGGLVPMFGNYYSVQAPKGNGWDGNYQYLSTTNGGKGFDLTAYHKPYITFLVNTNGKQGYFNPALTIGGSTNDKHFTKGASNNEYSDDYKITTNGWEWRSYDLAKMGWADVKSKIDKITLYMRGGNVGNNDAFELHIDQVMITDGPLNPVLAFDFETMPAFNGGTGNSQNGGTGVAAAGQGNKYLTVKDANTATWKGKGTIVKTDLNGAKFDANRSFYINYLINTGNDGGAGYFQLIFEQAGGTKLGMHFKGTNPYKDDYKFSNTAGKWQWRSYRIDPKGLENWGSVPELNLNSLFSLSVDFTSGNVSGKYETSVDYVIMTSVPLDGSLNK